MSLPPRDFARYRKDKTRRERLLRIACGTVSVIVILLLWQWGSQALGLVLILPRPVTVFVDIFDMLTLRTSPWLYGENVYQQIWDSIVRAAIGLGLSAIIAIPLGLVVGRVRIVRLFLLPVIMAMYPIPSVAWIPIALLWFGLTDNAIIFVVFMSEFFPLFLSAEAGSRLVSPLIVNAGRCFGASGFTLFFRVILPAAVPQIITGGRVAMGLAWRSVVAAELFAAQNGIGYMLMQARYLFRAADLITAMILISIVGYGAEKLIIGTLERRTIQKWEVSPN